MRERGGEAVGPAEDQGRQEPWNGPGSLDRLEPEPLGIALTEQHQGTEPRRDACGRRVDDELRGFARAVVQPDAVRARPGEQPDAAAAIEDFPRPGGPASAIARPSRASALAWSTASPSSAASSGNAIDTTRCSQASSGSRSGCTQTERAAESTRYEPVALQWAASAVPTRSRTNVVPSRSAR